MQYPQKSEGGLNGVGLGRNKIAFFRVSDLLVAVVERFGDSASHPGGELNPFVHLSHKDLCI